VQCPLGAGKVLEGKPHPAAVALLRRREVAMLSKAAPAFPVLFSIEEGYMRYCS
jgi:hypothetical protein